MLACWAVVCAHRCLVCRWLSVPPTMVWHKSCGESHSFAMLAETVFGVQSALQTLLFPMSPRLDEGLQVVSVIGCGCYSNKYIFLLEILQYFHSGGF